MSAGAYDLAASTPPYRSGSFSVRSDITGLGDEHGIIRPNPEGIIFLKDCFGRPGGFGGAAKSAFSQDCVDQDFWGFFGAVLAASVGATSNPDGFWTEPFRCLQAKALAAAALAADSANFDDAYLREAMEGRVFELRGPVELFWNTDRRWDCFFGKNVVYDTVDVEEVVGGGEHPVETRKNSSCEERTVSGRKNVLVLSR